MKVKGQKYIVQIRERDRWADTHWTNPVSGAFHNDPVVPVDKRKAEQVLRKAQTLFPSDRYRIHPV